MYISRRQRGMTLIELIVFIVIVSVALVGVLTVLNVTAKSSGDPMIRKQMLAVAEAVLEEVTLQPFTWCDPDDRSAATATSATLDATATDPTQCWDAVEAIGPETVAGNMDARPSAISPLDNVSDYDGVAILTGITGPPLPAGYSASVSVAQSSLNGIAATESLLITVTVSHAGDSVVLQGYRTRYAPNSLP